MADPILQKDILQPFDLHFNVDVQGSNFRKTHARLVIYANVNLMFIGEVSDASANGYSVHVPMLKGIVNPGIYKFSLEVIVDEQKFFVPVQSTIEFVQSVVVSGSIGESAPAGKTTEITNTLEGLENSSNSLVESSNVVESPPIEHEKAVGGSTSNGRGLPFTRVGEDYF